MRTKANIGHTVGIAQTVGIALWGLGAFTGSVSAQALDSALAKVARVELPAHTPPLLPDLSAVDAAPPTASASTTVIEQPAVVPTPPTEPEATPPASPAAVVIIADPIVADVRQRLTRAQPNVAKDDRAALQRAYGVEGAKPLWMTETALSPRGRTLLAELKRADDWGLKTSEFDLPNTPDAAVTADQLGEIELKLSLAALKYARNARGGRVDPTQLSSYLDRKAQLLPPKRIIDEVSVSAEPDAYLRGLHPQHPQFEKLRQAFLALRDAKVPVAAEPLLDDVTPKPRASKAEPKPETGSVRRLIANMEMWRWMPTDLGATHLIVNVPEFQFRLIRNGQVIHTERVITGKPETQTPIFSDMMETVVFKPTWNVPDSIKVKELLPALSRNPSALARQGLRVAYNGKEVDPTTINWATTDIRALHVFQPPGEANALGVVKFLFPNKHAVYLHDTPTKALFNSTRRTFSHGCIRVRNPIRLAEVLMENDRGWSPTQVRTQLQPGAPDANDTQLTKKFPVHIAYFTAWANDAGEMQYFSDVYGYETNIHLGLDGRAHTIVKRKEDLGPFRAEVVGRMVETKPTPANKDWMKSVFKVD